MENTASIVKEACLLTHCLAMDVLFLRALAHAGMCLLSHCLAMGLYVTILSKLIHNGQRSESLISQGTGKDKLT
jgi:hypothetical protein